MTRLGLSDSMRSTASTGDTGPLHTWKPRLFPLRWYAAESTPSVDVNTSLCDHMTKQKLASFAPLNPRRCLLGVSVAIIVLFSGFEVLSKHLGIERSSTLQVGGNLINWKGASRCLRETPYDSRRQRTGSSSIARMRTWKWFQGRKCYMMQPT